MEELQLIVNLIQQLGAEGKSAFIWWLIFDKVIIPSFILLAVWLILTTIRFALKQISNEEDLQIRADKAERELRLLKRKYEKEEYV